MKGVERRVEVRYAVYLADLSALRRRVKGCAASDEWTTLDDLEEAIREVRALQEKQA